MKPSGILSALRAAGFVVVPAPKLRRQTTLLRKRSIANAAIRAQEAPSMVDRCEPPEELREGGWVALVETLDGRARFCHRWWKARAWGWATIDARQLTGMRYLAPSPPRRGRGAAGGH